VDESGGCSGVKSLKDKLLGGSGNDTIRAQDGKEDIISGGPGRDTAYADPVDTVKGVEKKVVPKQCKDGIDNDGDGKTDLQDSGCASATGDTENSTTIVPQNPPVAKEDSFSIPPCSGIKKGVLNVDAPGVLGNDTDADGDTLSAVLVGTGPTHGTLTLDNNGSFKYIADCEIDQADSFTYKATDGAADSNVATVSLTVPNVPTADRSKTAPR
jgi:VCBS repeat-containing protein